MGTHCQAVRMSAGELGCTYAALILHADGQEISEEKMKTLMNAAKVEYEAYWPMMFCKALASQDMDELLTTPAVGGGAAAAGPAVAAPGAEGAADTGGKKEESSDDDADMAPATNIFGGEDDDY